MRLFYIVEVAAHMCPACGWLDEAVFVELIESRVGIRLQRAVKHLQVPLGMFAFAIRRVSEPHRGLPAAST